MNILNLQMTIEQCIVDKWARFHNPMFKKDIFAWLAKL